MISIPDEISTENGVANDFKEPSDARNQNVAGYRGSWKVDNTLQSSKVLPNKPLQFVPFIDLPSGEAALKNCLLQLARNCDNFITLFRVVDHEVTQIQWENHVAFNVGGETDHRMERKGERRLADCQSDIRWIRDLIHVRIMPRLPSGTLEIHP
ncbi:hypothetical protein FQN53_008218 [Emmonsiellopsis sp. PD_33]|nr:hypothetical protein FQN53_008218 [Emmonsiellopsis sp. PD_33]KAK2793292.1 hypothetical protein FQN51_001288 [Onygenales sp. PD_10]